ncbi:tyrosine-type recombinase/integrase [Fructobacillus sp. M158]|uniref:site-specific integrase n=1 Tax=Fructobacillus parabroussonetiae TaxID=2713174 RepID=UPI00200A0A95|nr:tyrosine-type recombinase/integrase [Fructobacillus parabroussonetiae]MCK8617335.1 tyrosine-type recombinase/integrase [Fructobacillus parabroussonetiae]
MATYTKTSSGKYRARVSIKENGKYKQIGKQGFRTKKEAVLWASEIESGHLDYSKNKYEDTLLSEYFEQWVDTYKSKMELATQYQYQNTLDNIIKYLPNVRLLEFSRSDFQNFINDFGKDHSKETVAKRKNHLSQALKDAFADGIIKNDPTIRIQLVGNAGKSASEKFLEKEELIKLNQYVKDKLTNYPHSKSYLAIFISIHTGMRIGEIMALQSEDVDFKKKTISVNKALDQYRHVKSTKTESSNRIISVDDELLEQLQGISGPIADVSNYGAGKVLKKAIHELDIKSVSFHALRHSHGSLLLSQGVDMKYVSNRLGHKNLSTTINIYTHLLSSQRQTEEEKTQTIMTSLF